MRHYTIVYGAILDKKPLRSIPHAELQKIRNAIEKKLTTHPEIFGKPLRRSLKGCWSLRVGDYRVIYRMTEKTVKIYAVEHHSTIYEEIERRLGG